MVPKIDRNGFHMFSGDLLFITFLPIWEYTLYTEDEEELERSFAPCHGHETTRKIQTRLTRSLRVAAAVPRVCRVPPAVPPRLRSSRKAWAHLSGVALRDLDLSSSVLRIGGRADRWPKKVLAAFFKVGKVFFEKPASSSGSYMMVILVSVYCILLVFPVDAW